MTGVEHLTGATVDTAPPVFTKCPTNMDLGCNPATIPDCDTSTNNVIATGCTPVITCAKIEATNGCVRTRKLIYTATLTCTLLSGEAPDPVGLSARGFFRIAPGVVVHPVGA